MCGVAFISGCSSVQFGVLFVGNGLAPFVAAIFAGNFHSNVAEPAVGLGTVPVLDVGRDGDHGAGGQADGRFALFLVPAFACGTNQQLAAALGGVVDVPVVAAVNWTPYSQSLVVTGFNGIHVCALCELFVTSSFARLFLCFVLVPNLFCKVEHCPAFWPACIECYVGDNRCDFFLRYPMILGIL